MLEVRADSQIEQVRFSNEITLSSRLFSLRLNDGPGGPTAREALIADESALRVRAIWLVIAVLKEVLPDRLRCIET